MGMGWLYKNQLRLVTLYISLFLLMTTNGNSQTLLPDWSLNKGLVLVYPERLPDNRKELVSFYDSLIPCIIKSTNLEELVIICRPEAQEKLKNKFSKIGKAKLIIYPTKNIQDIWVRDFAPIACKENVAIKAKYSPAYFDENEKVFCKLDDSVGLGLTKYINKEFLNLTFSSNEPIVIDGGNFIHNGNGIGVVSNRIISDNESHSIGDIQSSFISQLNLKELLFLPVEPGDETGHVDGMVRFVDENTVVVAKYPDEYEFNEVNISEKEYLKSQEVLNSIAHIFKGHGFEVHRITNDIPKNSKNIIGSAFGNYLNFLRIGNTIFIPQYGTKYDLSIDLFKKLFPKIKFIPVSFEISNLAKLGGVLNCISWTY